MVRHPPKCGFDTFTLEICCRALTTCVAVRLHRSSGPQLGRFLTCYGTEFALHYRLKQQLGIKTYFCDPHAPWQKGGVENAISRLRRPLPRKADLAQIHPRRLDAIVANYNATPRRCLGFRTPAEVFWNLFNPLHFNRETTSRPPAG